MKERFIERYKEAINKYFTAFDSDGRMIRSYIVNEYEHILEEEFEMSHEETREIYDELYKQHYGKKV